MENMEEKNNLVGSNPVENVHSEDKDAAGNTRKMWTLPNSKTPYYGSREEYLEQVEGERDQYKL